MRGLAPVGSTRPTPLAAGLHRGVPASGATFAAILTSGTWTASGYRDYLDTLIDEALNITRSVLEKADADSSDDDKPPDISRVGEIPFRILAECSTKSISTKRNKNGPPVESASSELVDGPRMRLSCMDE